MSAAISESDRTPTFSKRPRRNLLPLAALILLVGYGFARSVVAAESKAFWHDEMCTWIVSRQPTVSAIWAALKRPADGQPPLFYLVERGASRLATNEELSYRIVSIFAFCSAIVLIFLFLRKRCGDAVALICAVIPFLTLLFQTYAVESRPYALVVALISLALICYQRAPTTGWILLMGLSFMAAEALHYYGIFAVVPFAMAELVFSIKERKIRALVWIGFACALIPLAVTFPLLWSQKLYYGAHFWAVPTLTKAGGFYGWSINYYTHRTLIPWLLSTAGLGVIVALAFPKVRDAWLADPYLHEHVLAAGLLGLPFVAYIATKTVHGALDDRYTLPAILAYSLIVGYVLRHANRAVTLVVALLIFYPLATQEINFWETQRGHIAELQSPAPVVETLVNAANRPDLPVLISDGLDYLPLLHYASPELSRRFVFVADLPQELAYTKADSIGKGLVALQCCYPYHVQNFPEFSSEHPQFLMYSNGSFWDWWYFRLRQDGDQVDLVAFQKGLHVYLVTLKRSSTSELR